MVRPKSQKVEEARLNDGILKMKGVFKESSVRCAIQLLTQIEPIKNYMLSKKLPRKAKLAKSLG